jgi:nitrogen fixation protein
VEISISEQILSFIKNKIDMYEIISISHLDNPEPDVNEYLRNGWKLKFVTADSGRNFYHFIKKEKK